MPRPLYIISMGWYLAATVPEDKLRLLNQQIMILKMRGLITEIIDLEYGRDDPSCGRRSFSISPEFIWMPLAILIGPMVLAIISMIIAKAVIYSKEGQFGDSNRLSMTRSTYISTDEQTIII